MRAQLALAGLGIGSGLRRVVVRVARLAAICSQVVGRRALVCLTREPREPFRLILTLRHAADPSRGGRVTRVA
jgi:hypothetical protein